MGEVAKSLMKSLYQMEYPGYQGGTGPKKKKGSVEQ
jgi:hypothetical protein